MNRRSFVRSGISGLVVGAGLFSKTTAAANVEQQQGSITDKQLSPDFPRQDASRVLEVVGASHNNFGRVKELVLASPALAKASWDWGFGDWENALGAASHTGQREIALFLLEHGARTTIFSAAMLGQLAVVKAFVEALPGIQRTPGPHSIPLLAHARAGGESAREVVEYLESLGGADGSPNAKPLSEEEMKRYIGTYAIGTHVDDKLTVFERRKAIMIQRGKMTPRGLIHLGNDEFHPVGAEAVRIRFVGKGPSASKLEIHDAHMNMEAGRI